MHIQNARYPIEIIQILANYNNRILLQVHTRKYYIIIEVALTKSLYTRNHVTSLFYPKLYPKP